MELRKASRKKVKLRVALSGPSGSGKTMSALLMAYGITGDWSKVALIDTEHNSAEHYAVSGTLGTTEEDTFNVLELEAPYTPDRYIQAIETCEQDGGVEVIVIDSASHEWNGKGGILEMKDSIGGKSSFNAWEKLTPLHNNFIEKILSSSCHVFACFRAKTDYILVEKNGKQVPEKVGLKAITRDEVDYEFSVWFDLDMKNTAEATKDRTELFKGRPDFRITKETGRAMKTWADAGKSELQVAIEALKACADRACTTEVYNKYKHLHANERFMAAVKEMAERYPKAQESPAPAQEPAAAPAEEEKEVPEAEAPAAPEQEAAKYATPQQKEEIIGLLNNPVVTRQEKTKMLLNINRMDEAKAGESIEKLKKVIDERKRGYNIPKEILATPEQVAEIEKLLADEVITEAERLEVTEGLGKLMRLEAVNLLVELKKSIVGRKTATAA